MNHCLLGLSLFVLFSIAGAQEKAVTIQIKLVNGQTGNPMKNMQVGLEDGADYHEISLRTNESGIASLSTKSDAVILTHNTDEYVNCGDERGGLIHNDFKISQILSTGIVQLIEQPNLCSKTSSGAKPGVLVLFVRPWRFGEKI
jgi:hypothetical protein